MRIHAIEAKVLGERLSGQDRNTSLDEVSNSEGIVLRASAGETLVGNVEKNEVLLLLADGGQLCADSAIYKQYGYLSIGPWLDQLQ